MSTPFTRQLRYPFIVRAILTVLGLLMLMSLSAWAGMRWQAAQPQALSAVQQALLDGRALEQTAQLQGGLSALAGKVGELQGRLLAMDSVRHRVAQAAGVDGSLAWPGPAGVGAAVTPVEEGVMDDVWAGVPSAGAAALAEPGMGSAQMLGRAIDRLGDALSHQEDAYLLLDTALAWQTGFQASLPTLAPVDYPALSSSFGWRRNPVSRRQGMHEGLDFKAPHGAPIRAASGGLVVRAGVWGGYGRMVEIDHGNGLHTRYAHASSLLVKKGDIVRQGQLIARVGNTGRSTGAHLHFEVRMADYPMDPGLFLQQGAPVQVALGEADPPASTGPTAVDTALR